MKNQLQVQAWMFRLIVDEGLTPDSAAQRIRREDIEVYKLLSKNLEKALTELHNNYTKAFGPVSQAYMRLVNDEIALRGDVQAALHELSTTEPRDLRDIVKLVNAVGSRETSDTQGQPRDLVEALEYLDAADVDTDDFQARLDRIYPPVTASE